MAKPSTPTRRANHTKTTDAGTFRAWLTGHEDCTDDDTGESYTMLTYLMETPTGTLGYFANDLDHGCSGFFGRVW